MDSSSGAGAADPNSESAGLSSNSSTAIVPVVQAQPLSRYESQKRRDWNTFLQYLQNHKPPLTLSRCSGAHVLEFLKYLDQFGKRKVHLLECPYFGHPNPPAPCACPLRQAWGSLDALIGRLRAAYEENGGRPESNPFGAREVRIYLREVRESQGKARGIPYDKKKKRKRAQAAAAAAAAGSGSGGGSSSGGVNADVDPSMVGGAFLSASLQDLFDRLASQEVVNFSSWKRETNQTIVDGLLKKLKSKLFLLNKVLDDADVKQFTDTKVRAWSDEARDAVYQADDILSEITYEARRCQVESESSSMGKSFLKYIFQRPSFEEHIESKLKYTIALLNDLLEEAVSLGLKEVPRLPMNRSSSSVPVVTDVYLRDSEKESLIQRLLVDETSGTGVIPVVGMGGMGKTTLAQLAYHDRSVYEHFDTKAWVCVSQVFDIPRVTKTLLESITGCNCHFTDLNQVQESLKEKLDGMKFLVVLDDVWNLTYHEWDMFRAPFRSGAPGSKIIVTTRLQNTAVIMGTGPVINLAELSDDCSWSLFAEIAFGESDPSSHPHLEDIGKKFVKRCRGLPLAVKSLAGLLRSKPLDVGEWEDVLKSEIWDLTEDECDILPALRLSYHHLPSHLKQCFAFCSLFPKNYPFEEEKMASLWIAQKFLLPRKGTSYEQEGKNCFGELLSMSFFQQLGSTEDYPYFVMHDLIHDLAQVVSGEFAFRLDGGPQEEIPGKVDGEKQKEIPGKVRHCSYEVKGLRQLQAATEVKDLRTFLPVSITLRHQRWDGLDVKVLSRQKHMRVLSLPGYSKINDLADLVGSLIHLQYLDLSGTDMQQLPESICKLYNLETLLLVWCDSLTNLPADIGKLISLRQLNITGTNLTEMPKQMSQLKRLEYLSTFVVGKESGLAIGGLKAMSNLKGKLQISGLENVRDKKDALEAKLVEKEHLETLTLEWGGVTDDSQHEREVLDNLQPHTNLKGLGIRNYGGTMFPDWMGSNLFNQMVSLRLEDCQNCVFMPPLGQLPCLKELVVQGMTSVVEVGQEFLGNSAGGNQPFPSLEALLFKDMLEWVIWHLPGEGEFPKLRKFEMINCPSFVGTLPEKDIANISIARCPSLASVPCSSSDEKQVDVVAKEPRFQSKHAWQAALQELKTNHSSNVEEGGSKAMIHLIWNHIDPIAKLCLRWVVSHSNRERLTATSMVSSWLADGLVQTQAEGEELSNDMIKSGLLVDHYSRGITLKKVFQDLLLKYVIRSLGLPSTARAIVDDAEIINLANSEVSALPDSPVCSQVVLLCLQSNRKIMVIPPLFFQHMPLLSTLNLSYTSIKTLPASISALVSLRKLRLRGCDLFLELPPEIGTLADLEVIDLEGTRVTHLPDEIAQLQKLQSLKLSFYACEENHRGNTQQILEGLLLSSRNSLKELWIGVDPDADAGAGEWIANIHSSSYKNLSSIALHVPNAELLGRDFISGKNYKLIVGGNGQHMMSRIPSDIEEEFKQQTRLLKYVNGEHIPIEIMDTLRYSNAFILERHWTVKSLSEFGTERMPWLKFCLLAECNELQTIFDGNYAIFNRIEYLYIYYMKNLRRIWSSHWQVTTSVDILWLKHLSLCTCMMLDSVFSISLLGNLPNLEELVVEDCPKIESLVFQDCAWVHQERYFLPRLQKISLRELPELVSISSGIQIAPNLEKLVIFYCPKLGSISEVLGGKLKVVKGETEWWDSLSWKETDRLANIFVPLQKDGDLMAQFTQD